MQTLKNFSQELIDEAFALSDDKGKDYRKGSDTVHANFLSVGEHMRIEPMIVLGIYMKKHFDALSSYFVLQQDESEPIRERVKDAINYLILGMPLIAGETPNSTEFGIFRRRVAGKLMESMESLTAQEKRYTVEDTAGTMQQLMDIITSRAIPDGDINTYYTCASALIAALIILLYKDVQS